MEQTQWKWEYQAVEAAQGNLPVIVAAAGASSRMGGIHKQFAEIAGVPVLARTLMALDSSRYIGSIILVVRPEDVFAAQALVSRYLIRKVTDLIEGGSNRQESVQKGLDRLDQAADKVLIHDGARPFADDVIIGQVAAALEQHPAVTCCVPVKDTIKQIDGSGKVTATPDRKHLVAVQTPQGVWVSEYREALQKAGDLSGFTDDMSIMEQAGYPVFTVPGNYRNLKITTAEDLRIAASLLEGEEE